MPTQKEQSLIDALEEKAALRGVEIVSLEIVGTRKAPTIKVYIDTEAGVGFDELTSSQVWINEVMDAVDPFPGSYTLEVSSHGIDRPLRTVDHFKRFAGETAVIQTSVALDDRRKWTGELVGIEDDKVVLEVDGSLIKIPFADISRARLKGKICFNS